MIDSTTPENIFQQFINRGLLPHLLPIIPPDAVISPNSTIDQSACGKQPGLYDKFTNTWSGYPSWSIATTTIEDLILWSTWPLVSCGGRTRVIPLIDIDIKNPVLAGEVSNFITTIAGDTAKRTREGSPSELRLFKLADGETPRGKCRIVLADGEAVELLWGGQQAVFTGMHSSGAMQHFSGELITVTVEQLDAIWNALIVFLGDRVLKVTKAGETKVGVNNGGDVVHEATDEKTIQQAQEYINTSVAPAEGERNDTAYKLIAHVRQRYGITPETLTQLMQPWAERCDPVFPMSDIITVINSTYGGNAQSAQGSGHSEYVLNNMGFTQQPVPDYVSNVPVAAPAPTKPVKPKKPPARIYPEVSDTGKYPVCLPIPPNDFSMHHLLNNKPLSTLQNFKHMLNAYSISVGYDVISKDLLINQVDNKYNDKIMIHGSDISSNANWSQVVNLCKLNQMETGVIDHFMYSMMIENETNPVEEWIHSKPWDGVDRYEALFNTLTLSLDMDRDLAWMIFRKWFAGACQIVQRQIDHFEFVLVLQDIKGGKGKTAWFNKLTEYHWRKDGVRLDPDNKDTIKQALGYWLVELGELDSIFKKSEIKALMSFLGLSMDEIRLPYAKTANKYARRSAFMGSVNDDKFLIDDSGDRRFWPISVTSINYDHNIDMQQFWAQVDHLRERHWLNDEENEWVIRGNKEFKALDPLDESLESYFSKAIPGSELNCLSISVILQQTGITHPNMTQLKKAGRWLREHGYKKGQGKGTRGYMVPTVNMFTPSGG